MKKNALRLSRRNFLVAATAGTAVTAAAIVSAPEAGKKSIGDASDQRGKGYQATDHVENYYRTARI